MTRYITARQADALQRIAMIAYQPAPEVFRVVGWCTLDDYYVVADDDPRLQGQTPDPRFRNLTSDPGVQA